MTTSPHHRTPLLTVVRERWVAIVLTILAATFVAQNRNRVDLNMFWIHLRMPLWFVLTVMTVVGVLVALMATRHRRT